MKCLMQAWQHNESDIKAWLICKTHDVEQAEDLMQETFLKAMKHQERFCSLDNARSWLFKMVRNTLIDHIRTQHPVDKLTADLGITAQEKAPIMGLLSCLPRVLSELDDEDRDVIECCDLNGMTQADYAQLKDISTAGAKSRIQRARQKLKQHLTCACQVKFAEQKVCSYVPRHKL
ncbi:sigma-70 family RNA polymerase sigma factor [Photobacterium lipolyticum]|uniref:RNA polymerase subunit sigma-70 n=1 Tax=Photobacterium lipolyticum TaxID=266810 RepID=A0A2T3MWG3_9GAMM|nr:sigma-70 family RNA polymerase sigma factor [Photobacterium lipolyticum]PSW04310.1 RNA polymerase subunit sigma-70 [Photobacterium lipolyticum]